MSVIAWGPQGLAVVKLKEDGSLGSGNTNALSIPDRDIATASGDLTTDSMINLAKEGLCLDLHHNQAVLRRQIQRYRELQCSVVRSVGYRNTQGEQVLLASEYIGRIAPLLEVDTVESHAPFESLAHPEVLVMGEASSSVGLGKAFGDAASSSSSSSSSAAQTPVVDIVGVASGTNADPIDADTPAAAAASLSSLESSEVACGPLTAYESRVRRRCLEQCGWSELPSPEKAASMLSQLAKAKAKASKKSDGAAAMSPAAATPSSSSSNLSLESLVAAVPIPLVRRCCEEGDLERAAAITLLHGFPGPAVQLLMVASDILRDSVAQREAHMAINGAMAAMNGRAYAPPTQADEGGSSSSSSNSGLLGSLAQDSEHAELLQLTAMAVAGCPGPASASSASSSSSASSHAAAHRHHNASSSSSSALLAEAQREASRHVWLSSVRALMQRVRGNQHPYMRMALQVLLEVADPETEQEQEAEDEEDEDGDGDDEDNQREDNGLERPRASSGGGRRQSAGTPVLHGHPHPHPPSSDGLLPPLQLPQRRPPLHPSQTAGNGTSSPAARGEATAGAALLAGKRTARKLRAGSVSNSSLGLVPRPAHNLDTLGGAKATSHHPQHPQHPQHRQQLHGLGRHHRGSSSASSASHGSPALSASVSPVASPERQRQEIRPSAPLPAPAAAAAAASIGRTMTMAALGNSNGNGGQDTTRPAAGANGSLNNNGGSGSGGAAGAVQHIEISLHDRIAFACRFLEDAHVGPYLSTLQQEVVERGRIDGLPLTGLTPKGSRLVQQYLDATADVQTAAVIGCYMLRATQVLLAKRALRLQERVNQLLTATTTGGTADSKQQHRQSALSLLHVLASPASLLRLVAEDEQRMAILCWRWIFAYRELLTKLQLWHQRAAFDVQRSKLLGTQFKHTSAVTAAAAASSGSSGTAAVAGLVTALSANPNAPLSILMASAAGAAGVGRGGPLSSSSSSSVLCIAREEVERLSFAALLSLASYSGGLVPQPSLANVPGWNSSLGAGAGAGHGYSSSSASSASSGGSVLITGGVGGMGQLPEGASVALSSGNSKLMLVAGAANQQQLQGGLGAAATAAADGILGLGPKRSQLYLRCSSCRTSLALPALVAGSASAVEWLSKQRPHMLSCPSCRKTLPRCSLCLLPLGCINPYLQLEHDIRSRSAGANTAGAAGADAAGELSTSAASLSLAMDMFPGGSLRDAVSIGDLWTFCQSCKHGGHASHLKEWFASGKKVCPVAECMCHCASQDGFLNA